MLLLPLLLIIVALPFATPALLAPALQFIALPLRQTKMLILLVLRWSSLSLDNRLVRKAEPGRFASPDTSCNQASFKKQKVKFRVEKRACRPHSDPAHNYSKDQASPSLPIFDYKAHTGSPLKVHWKLLLWNTTAAVYRRLHGKGLEGYAWQDMQRCCIELRINYRCLHLLGPSCLLPVWTRGRGEILHA